MSQLWGAPAGIEAADQEFKRDQLFKVQMAEAPLRLQELALDNQQKGLAVETAQLALDKQRQFLALLSQQQPQQGGSGPGGSDPARSAVDQQAGQMEQLGNLSMQSGLPEQAKTYYSTASTLRKNQADIEKSQQLVGIRNLNIMGELIPTVHDQQSWAQANAMFEMKSGKPSPFAQLPYSPELMEQLRHGYQTDLQRVQAAAAATRQREAEERTRSLKLTEELTRARIEQTRARTEALKKNGGKSLVSTASDVKGVTDLIDQEYQTSGAEQTRNLARPIADRALAIVQQKGIPKSEAYKQAFDEAARGGTFEGLKKQRQLPGTNANPIALTTRPDPKTLKVNQYYQLPNGQVGVWNGSAFAVPKQAVGADDGLDEPDEDTDDEQEEQ